MLMRIKVKKEPKKLSLKSIKRKLTKNISPTKKESGRCLNLFNLPEQEGFEPSHRFHGLRP